MSSRRGSGSSGSTSIRDKLFNPSIDVEQVVLDWIHNVGNSAILVSTVGDATQANTVFTMQVLNLDSFVFSLLTSDASRNWNDYTERRRKIIDNWPKDAMGAASRARQLYELVVTVWATQRLFKLRRYTYFGMGWKKEQEVSFDAMAEQDEKEGEEETPVEG